VRAILGQQISVRAATTIADRLASMCGAAPAQLARAEIERAGAWRPWRAYAVMRSGTINWRERPMASPDHDTLVMLNEDYIRSVQLGDVKRFSEILADDFLCSLPDGSLIDRGRFLERTAQPVTIANLQAHEVNVRLMGDFAIIHARTSYTIDGRAASGRYTDVWARRDGQWLAVSAHVTRN